MNNPPKWPQPRPAGGDQRPLGGGGWTCGSCGQPLGLTDLWGFWEGSVFRVTRARCPACGWQWVLSGKEWDLSSNSKVIRLDLTRAPVGYMRTGTLRGASQ